ncbi:HAD family phosphatase [bacterium]|nr:HAD family phosphatase [bacterium]
MGVKLVALDIDGTLIPPGACGSEVAPSERILNAVAALADRGIAVVLASGRMFPGTQKIARALQLPGPVICQQGCSVHLLDGTMTHEFPIERTTALEIIDYARQIDRAYEWFNPLRYIASRRSEASEQYGAVSGITPEYRPDPENSGIDPTGVGIISDAAKACTYWIFQPSPWRWPRTQTKGTRSRSSAPTLVSSGTKRLPSATA